MENSPAQDAEDNSYLCFQRTPSLRRKWRKRYGGLDGNKLLEPSRDDDNRENGLTTEPRQERNTQGQDTAPVGTVPRPLPRASQQSPPPQRPISLGGPGPAGNGALKPPLPQSDPDRSSSSTPQTWTQLNRTTETQPGLIKRRAAADMLFDSFASDGRLNINQFFEAVWSSGIQRSDSRIRDCFVHMRKLQDSAGTVDRSTFLRCVTGFVSLILKALQGRFVIPDFSTFSEETQKLFTKCKQLSTVQDKEQGGEDSRWAVSICTVDGQRLSLGDCSGSVVLGEASWPLLYGLSVDQLGPEYVHRYVGLEEYSKYTSPFTLTSTGVPHSPLIETGAIVTTSLLQMSGRLCTEEEEKYESVLNMIRRLCNKENVNLNCSSYQGNRKDSVRLHALSFYLQEKQCFPEAADINATLDLLLQCASTEVTCESGAALAASLANGGLCPLSGDQVLSPGATRSMLSMMQVAGMKDYSRMFHYKTSVPAVSSQHGVLLAVIPGVLGLFCSSPQLDAHKNPWRAVHFCQELVSLFQLHCFDIRTPFRQLLAYRQWKTESEGYQIMNILLAAFRGDLQSLRRYFLSGGEVNAVDYDGRSALHVAAAQGHTEVISFLVENTGANHALKDRWGNSPLQEARRHNKTAAAGVLLTYQEQQEAE